MSEMLITAAIVLLYPIFTAFWRRWFGGGAPEWLQKWPSGIRRFTLNLVNFAAMFALCYWYRGIHWGWALYVAAVMQFIYWNYTFGMYMDMGRYLPSEGTEQWKAMESDYLEDPVNKYLLNWIFEEKRRYGQYYDAFGMTFRYMWPCLFLVFVPTFNLGMLALGPLVAFCYEMWFVFQEKGILQESKYTRDINEYGAGFFTGLFLAAV